MLPGDICLANFRFGDAPGLKLRPVLVLTAPVGPLPEVVVAYITAVIPETPSTFDMILHPSRTEHAATNLKAVSVVHLHRLATLPAWCLVRHLGKLSPETAVEAFAKLRALLPQAAALEESRPTEG